MSINYDLDIPGWGSKRKQLDKTADGMPDTAADVAKKVGDQAKDAAIKATPRAKRPPTNRKPTADSWTLTFRKTRDGAEADLGNTSPIADLLWRGTRPHKIKPRGKALKFMSGSGQLVFAKTVDHPGTRPRDPSAEIAKLVDRVGNRVLREAADKLVTGIARVFD